MHRRRPSASQTPDRPRTHRHASGPGSNGDQILLLEDGLLRGAQVPLIAELGEGFIELRLAPAVAGVRLGDDSWAELLLEVLCVVVWMLKGRDSQHLPFERAKIDAIPEQPPYVLLAAPQRSGLGAGWGRRGKRCHRPKESARHALWRPVQHPDRAASTTHSD